MKKRIALLLIVSMVLMMSGITSFAVDHDDEFILYAGQDMAVGTVNVSNDGEFINVLYALNGDALVEGWLIYETHVHVGDDLDDFPLTKKGNPQVGLFDYGMHHDPGVEEYEVVIPIGDLKPGDDLMIAAHAVIEKTECIVNAEAPYGGSSVIDAVQGFKYDYTAVKAVRSVPENALLYETGHSENYFYSLGFMEDRDDYNESSWIVIEFEDPIVNGDGFDLQVVEDTWGLPYPVEKAEVFVSNDNTNWTSLGCADNQTPSTAYHTISNFELPDSMESVRFVKVQDASLRADFDSRYPSQVATLDGFDLNAVLALHDNTTCETYSQSAWAEGTRFVDQGNWATYFEYVIHGETLADTVYVPSNGVTVYSSIDLIEGQSYRLEASGTFIYSSAVYKLADAEWFEKEGGWIKGETGVYADKTNVIDVSVNGYPVNDDWGDYNPAHVYSMNYEGTGEKLNFFIFDTNYTDNEGSIKVEIYKVW
ncbi:MAG: discoidin domain-containing protein [Dethiosulfatibacter sp.]|nr:discoidin domain-containing protein [Dethiosulfatibacter sp.]